ncbi:hypothetical protein [Streptomyces sp. CT34]|nr:hypothetical protein [Streptomyces sp. CT34]
MTPGTRTPHGATTRPAGTLTHPRAAAGSGPGPPAPRTGVGRRPTPVPER